MDLQEIEARVSALELQSSSIEIVQRIVLRRGSYRLQTRKNCYFERNLASI